MNHKFNGNPFIHKQEQHHPTTSPPLLGDETAVTTIPSPKKSRKGLQKRVVSVRMDGVDGSRSKGDVYPPSDSWTWRKYGQKPIKGSLYPRGYYRCSSSKGCPARKQVERSCVDPGMVVITYAREHNHHLPTTTTANKHNNVSKFPPEEVAVFANQLDIEPEKNDFAEFSSNQSLNWFSDVEIPMIVEPTLGYNYDDVSIMLTMGEEAEEESLFADLGELPECSLVFRPKHQHCRPCFGGTLDCGSSCS